MNRCWRCAPWMFLVGCSPRIELAPPQEPITINLNIKIEHEIRVKIDKDLDSLFKERPGVF
jgi:hypothetical protein